MSSEATIECSPSPPHPPIPCRDCGTIDTPTLAPGAGPHWRSARCQHCGAFLQWLAQHSPEERWRLRQAARDDWMARKPASTLQLSYLRALGDVGPPPATMLEASQRIDSLTRKAQP